MRNISDLVQGFTKIESLMNIECNCESRVFYLLSDMYTLRFLCETTAETTGFRASFVNCPIEQTSVNNPGSGPVTL